MTMLLTGANVMIRNRDKIPSNKGVRLLFQPAEEGPGGAKPMVEEGCMEGTDEVYGCHNMPNYTAGQVRVCDGPIFSEVTLVKIRIVGHGGHGSSPHKTRDPINAAAFVLTALNVIKSRVIHSKENFTFTICNISGGSTYNVMPSECFMQGTLRTYNEAVRIKVCERIREIAMSTAVAHDCEAVVDL
jgi:hippurate hydrolase